ncbi:hypothetical protein [Streptomyces noursei]|uniref:hypothetical protein n=1 Tax=Streptomyces noursei TaxID=1971 RepID=UPI0015E07DA0|nr:hypothetical protein [Streptomyces noursei]
MQVQCESGERDRQPADDDQEQGEGAAAEVPAAGVVELTELGDGGGGGLDPGGQGHGDGEGEHHGEDGGPARVGGGRGLAHGVWVGEAEDQYGEGDDHEEQGHCREQQAAAVAEPGQPGHQHQQPEGQGDAGTGACGEERDRRVGCCRDGHADGQHEVDDQRTDRQEGPAWPERPPCRGGRPTALGEAAYQLSVVGGHHDDRAGHQGHGGQQQRQVRGDHCPPT